MRGTKYTVIVIYINSNIFHLENAMNARYCVVDIGTLKVKAIIASVTVGGGLDVLFSSNTLTCFGCEIEANGGNVKEEYCVRTIAELKRIKGLMEQYDVAEHKVVSTHAMRKAKNRDEIIERIKREVGFEVENISQEQEAEFFFHAAMRGFTSHKEYAIVDVGGGSVQVLIGTPHSLTQSHMMHTGAQFLHDNFTQNPNEPASFTTPQDIERMKELILEQITPLKTEKKMPIVYGSSMIIDIMKNLGMYLEEHKDSTTHPYQTYKDYLDEFVSRLLPLSYEQREKAYEAGQKGYIWGVDKAFLNIVTIAEYLESPYIIPSNANIAQGIVYSMAGA